MTLVMGVLNVTPDSFSDGGAHFATTAAIEHGVRMTALGAEIVDVGGESTRPGADRVPSSEEQQRILPVIEGLTEHGVTVSVDTVNADTARAAVSAGASYINDVSGGSADPLMARIAAETGAKLIIGHWRGIPDPKQQRSHYSNVVTDVRDALGALAERALTEGVSRDQIIIDPGLGFDKSDEQGWQLLAHHDALAELGFPVLYGVSRKRMLRTVLEEVPEAATGAADRDLVTAVTSALAAQAGAWGVRVHAVHETMQALAVARAWQGGAA